MKNEFRNRDNRWNSLHKTGGISAIVIAVLLLGEIIVYAVLPNPTTPVACIELFQRNPLFGLLHYDLLGMISYILFIPMILSFYILLRQNSESGMLIATVLFFIGIAVFFASNTSFSMLSLSRQYTLSETDAERAAILASCRTMLTLFNVQAFMISYIIVSASWIMIGSVMLSGKLFGRFIAYTGILAGASGIIAEVLENTSEALRWVAIAFYFAAVVFLFLWVFLAGRQLLLIGSVLQSSDNKNKANLLD